MKKHQTKPIHDTNSSTASSAQSNPPVLAQPHVFKLGLDVDLHNVVTAIQCDRGTIALAQKFSRARLRDWIQKQIAAGHQVHTVYEACGFGYTLHSELVAAG